MTREKVLMLVHPKARPQSAKGTERDVWSALRRMGCAVEVQSLRQDLRPLDQALARFRPTVVFNLLEEFRDEGVFDFHPVSFLEAHGVPFTGCNPRALVLTRNKLWVSRIASAAGVATPETRVGEWPKTSYPAFVKFNREHASLGIRGDNRASTPLQLKKVLRRMRALSAAEILIQEFIPGEEISVAAFGNHRPVGLPPWQLRFADDHEFATERVKFSAAHRRARAIRAGRYSGGEIPQAVRAVRELYRSLDLNGYARFDFRVRAGKIFLLDVNANPNLAKDEDFACSARQAGFSYTELVAKILRLAKNYSPRI